MEDDLLLGVRRPPLPSRSVLSRARGCRTVVVRAAASELSLLCWVQAEAANATGAHGRSSPLDCSLSGAA